MSMTKEQAVSALKSLIGTRAETPFEKYKLLEERDKILRKVRHRIHDVQRASVFVGTCQDMCPEKERYEREVQKRLSSYEMIFPSGGGGSLHDATVDHRRSVKDYGRSAADQEEPLPHELRPASVLDMTMNYLLTEIAYNEPNDESHLPGWYDFLWKRTRAIRKDMTQQMLEGDLALSLLEKCARFHIFSAHRLCELEIGEFDQKMNTENLTKCLQSLKHMYEDSSKKGLACVNEAEFRSYDVLLSLNDTNVLRQILTYDVQVRQSPHIRFALELFSAMQSNNYVAFFRLVRRRATYLQACVVFRYFNDVRVKALETVIRAYKAITQIPITDLMRWLGFEDEEETLRFASMHGLTQHPKDPSMLIVNRWHGQQEESEDTDQLRRSHLMVESKRVTNLGEILNGGPVSKVTLPLPLISFDEYHNYRGDKVIRDFLEAPELLIEETTEKPKSTWMPTMNHPPRQQQPAVFGGFGFGQQQPVVAPVDKIVKQTASSVLESVVRTQVIDKARVQASATKVANNILAAVVVPFVRSTALEAIEEAKQKAVEVHEQEQRKKLIDGFKNKTIESVLTGVIKSTLTELAQEVRGQAFRTHAAQRLRNFSQDVRSKILEATFKEQIRSICNDYYRRHIESPLEKLVEIKQNLSNILVRKYFDRWRTNVLFKVYRRKVFEDFPSCPMNNDEEDSNGPPPGKRVRIATKLTKTGGIESAYNWLEMLDARRYATDLTDFIVKRTVDSSVRAMATDEIRKHKLWYSKFGHDHALLADGPSNRAEVENAKKRIFDDFSSVPSIDYETGYESSGLSGRKRFATEESVYGWMDDLKSADADSTENQSAATSFFAFPKRPMINDAQSQQSSTMEIDDGRRDCFREIALTSQEIERQETLEMMRRLRSTVNAEKQAGDEDLSTWNEKLNDESSSTSGNSSDK